MPDILSMKGEQPGLDDPIWEHLIRQRIMPYIDAIRAWWSSYEEQEMTNVGVEELERCHGVFIRWTRTAARSPIKGVQVFPFIPVRYLNITGIEGGVISMFERVCPIELDEFTILFKNNLPATGQQTGVLCIIPTTVLQDTTQLGAYIYLKRSEMLELLKLDSLSARLYEKLMLKV